MSHDNSFSSFLSVTGDVHRSRKVAEKGMYARLGALPLGEAVKGLKLRFQSEQGGFGVV